MHASILAYKAFLLAALNAGDPVNNSYVNAPIDHQSTAFPCPFLFIISGANYSGVPQNENADFASITPSLQKPKSVILI